ncbi:MAG: helix-turn-helix domain-containing protein [Butyrivibrio sp.]|nr:helix-turn-helix domain-containing protein [Butyrivibrio sp.]
MGKSKKKRKKSGYLSYMDIWLACCGDKDAMYKVIQRYEYDVENCIMNRSTQMNVHLSKEDFEDLRQEVYYLMLRAMKKFEIK